MARYYGRIGYGVTEEQMIDEIIDEVEVQTPTGVWVESIVERFYYGDVVQNIRSLREGEYLNSDLNVQNSISIVADAYANDHFFAIRFIEWAGTLWTVSSVDVQSPRLILRLGEVYNGPEAAVTPTP